MFHPVARRRRLSPWLARCLVLWLMVATGAPVFAHDPGLSSIRVTVAPAGLEAVLTIHLNDLAGVDPDLDVNHDGQLDAAEFTAARRRFDELARQVLVIIPEKGPPLAPVAEPEVSLTGDNNLQVRLRFLPVSAGSKLTVASPLVPRLPRGHRQFVEVADASGKPLAEGFLTASADRLSFGQPPAGPPAAAVGAIPATGLPRPARFGEFFSLGVNHLLTGYDHLLFLGGLLIVCRRLLRAFQMLTLFTVAHSVTLALVTLNLIRPSTALVEPAIAASIAYIGVENILRPRADLSWRGALTFVFGLVHGMGFAGALKELGVGSDGGGVFRPLFFFSLGLETTQLGLAALVFPLLLWLRTKPVFPRLGVPACSGLIALAGLYWFVERTLFSAG